MFEEIAKINTFINVLMIFGSILGIVTTVLAVIATVNLWKCTYHDSNESIEYDDNMISEGKNDESKEVKKEITKSQYK